jgi:hypothetical protein
MLSLYSRLVLVGVRQLGGALKIAHRRRCLSLEQADPVLLRSTLLWTMPAIVGAGHSAGMIIHVACRQGRQDEDGNGCVREAVSISRAKRTVPPA